MNAQIEQGDWMMGGSTDEKANAVVGISEAEVAQMVIEAYAYAWDKCRGDKLSRGGKSRWVHELTQEFEYNLRERLDVLDPE
ncbi:hypothetical protein [Dyella tabacisoli]|uniref:Uncharacterized protein n=1 Tax=Dyella tabacisoli TaxID=2282381 RepID=A0A369UJ30_9GAMM|nr:hypothetical protein [Dyella tabacisoli]RDD79728.1 hypothetical protein DVJ77_20855 [Dyella tabacisoli]